MRSVVVAVVIPLVGGCGSKAPPTAPISSSTASAAAPAAPVARPAPGTVIAPPAGFATAEFVIMDGGELATYEIEAGTIKRTSAVTLVEADEEQAILAGFGELDWADRDHLFVKTADRAIVHVTATSITPVAIPVPARFKTPRPTVPADQAGDLTEGSAGSSGATRSVISGLIVTSGAASWQECAWGFPYDGFQCEVYVTATLWPTPALVIGTPVVRANRELPEVVPPKFKLLMNPRSTRAFACIPGPGKQTVITANTEDSDEHIDTARWIAASPPRLLVTYGTFGLADLIPTRWTLHDGCTVAPIAHGGTIEVGFAGLWMSTDETDDTTHRVLRRAGDVIGELPTTGYVRFRPSAK